MNINKYRNYAPFVLRAGLGFVFIWFGWGSVTNPEMWTRMVPAWTSFLATPETLLYIHGIFEIIFGALLIVGIYIRIVSFLLLVNLIHTITLVSGPTLIRDVGLAAALFSIFLQGKSRG